jgi:hypothetical protein
MTTTITSTLIAGPHALAPDFKIAVYKLAFPTSWTAAGVALDLSADFDYVTSYIIGCSGAAGDHGYRFNLIGTYTAAGVAASGLSVVAHWSAASAAALDDVDNSTNLSSVNDLILTVFGN